jgi:hypothetical protein
MIRVWLLSSVQCSRACLIFCLLRLINIVLIYMLFIYRFNFRCISVFVLLILYWNILVKYWLMGLSLIIVLSLMILITWINTFMTLRYSLKRGILSFFKGFILIVVVFVCGFRCLICNLVCFLGWLMLINFLMDWLMWGFLSLLVLGTWLLDCYSWLTILCSLI